LPPTLGAAGAPPRRYAGSAPGRRGSPRTGAVVSHLGGLLKDNTGYDLGGLLCGSEGTLGVVTAARLRLVAPTPQRVVALIAFASTAAAVDAAFLLRRSVSELQSLELFLHSGLALVCQVSGTSAPFSDPHPAYLLAEAAGEHDPAPALAEALVSIEAIADVAVATDSPATPNCGTTGRGTPRPSIRWSAPQARRHLAVRRIGSLHRTSSRHHSRHRPRGHHVAVRPRGRRQHPCEHHRSRP